MANNNEIERRRTFAIIAHPDAGKTSLTEKLLLFGGQIQVAGAVKSNKIKKTATSDWMDIEKQRGISVTTSVMEFDYHDYKVNILDTPGHQDFAEDTYRTLTAVDSVIIVSVTWALATISFVYFNVWGIKAKGGLTYLKSFAPAGLPKVMVPIIWFLELISTCIRWLTLAVRLYGNMFAGHMVLGIFALASSVFLTCGIQALDPISGVLSLPWFLLLIAMYALETLVAFLQAYVFTVLSAVYVQIATSAH